MRRGAAPRARSTRSRSRAPTAPAAAASPGPAPSPAAAACPDAAGHGPRAQPVRPGAARPRPRRAAVRLLLPHRDLRAGAQAQVRLLRLPAARGRPPDRPHRHEGRPRRRPRSTSPPSGRKPGVRPGKAPPRPARRRPRPHRPPRRGRDRQLRRRLAPLRLRRNPRSLPAAANIPSGGPRRPPVRPGGCGRRRDFGTNLAR